MSMHFKVGEMLILESPHDPGHPIEVMYRGKIGSNATVIHAGIQMTIPVAWLRRNEMSIREQNRVLSGVIVRCYGSRTGTGKTRCGWVGDSSEVRVVPFGEHRCPRCDGSTTPTARLRSLK